MNNLLRTCIVSLRSHYRPRIHEIARTISTTPVLLFHGTQEGHHQHEHEHQDQHHDGKLTQRSEVSKPEPCLLCRLDIRNLQYTDVMILGQFLDSEGSLMTYRESRLCSKQYHLVERLIKKAQRCNLLKRPSDYFVPGPWHDLNTYLEPDRKRDQPRKVIKPQYWKI